MRALSEEKHVKQPTQTTEQIALISRTGMSMSDAANLARTCRFFHQKLQPELDQLALKKLYEHMSTGEWTQAFTMLRSNKRLSRLRATRDVDLESLLSKYTPGEILIGVCAVLCASAILAAAAPRSNQRDFSPPIDPSSFLKKPLLSAPPPMLEESLHQPANADEQNEKDEYDEWAEEILSDSADMVSGKSLRY